MSSCRRLATAADNRALVDALRDAGRRARGVATVKPEVSDEELRLLDEAGVRGVRFNFVRRLVDTTPREVLLEIARRVASLDWHVVIYFEAADLPEFYDFFASPPDHGGGRPHGPTRMSASRSTGRSSHSSCA